MEKLEMRNSLGTMIAVFCLAVLPQAAQAAKSGKATQAPPATTKATPSSKAADLENALWGLVQKSDARNDYDTYLAQYPQGRYVKQAKARIAELDKLECIFSNSGKAAPLWVCDAPVEGAAIGAVGSAPNSALGVDSMKQQAVANARDLIAKQHFSTVHVATKKSADKSTGAVSKETWTTPQPIIDKIAQDSKVLKDIIGPDGTVYVFVGLDEAAALKLKELAAKLNK